MRLSAEVLKPETVDVRVCVIMTVAEWREITDALKDESFGARWSAAKFRDLLTEQLRNVERTALGVAERPEGA